MASISIRCPSCSATEGVVRNGKSTAGHQRYLCSHCRKTWQLQFTYTASQPGTHLKWSTKTGHRVRVFPVSIFRFVW
ncbi:IS1 family transposase, partial [Shigella boydii]|uniref:IS1 family transposase n=1 Tax=Shigella boydii TaxID=621 RepID=UPI00338F8A7C